MLATNFQWRLAWLALVPLLLVREAFGDETRPNFVLCMADDQGWGDVGYHGGIAKTPVLDAMAASGLRLDRFYSASSVCSPTRGSVLTGRNPNRFGCFSWGHELRPQEVTLAEALRAAGYTTGHFGKWHLGPVAAGAANSPGESGFDEWLSSPNFFENDPPLSHRGQVEQKKGEGSRVIVDAALEFIKSARNRNKPFLAVVWFGSPHSPHEATEALRSLYPGEPRAVQHYYGEVSGVDAAVGELRRGLRSLNLADNTLVWYTSDNGPQGPEGRPGSTGGFRGRKASLWEGGIRVPTILEWPGRIKQARRSELPCASFDIYPTLLELAGVKVDAQVEPLEGVSLTPLIAGEMMQRDKPLGFWDVPVAGRPVKSAEILREMQKRQADGALPEPVAVNAANEGADSLLTNIESLPGHAAWINGDWKLHRIPGKSGEARHLLFNLAADPHEKIDLADQEPQRLAEMQRGLQQWQESVVASLRGDDYKANFDMATSKEQDVKARQFRVYVGTYTGPKSKGIYVLEFDASLGSFSEPTLAAETPNPTFLALHPHGNLLYCINETLEFRGEKAGSASAFSMDDPTGKLRLLNQQSTGGTGPCHLTIDRDGSFIIAANYGGGSAALLPINADGSLGMRSDFVQHAGTDKAPDRQQAPHAHCARLDPSERFALVADLGLNQVKVYDLKAMKGRLTPHDPPAISLPPGAGPRHLAFDAAGRYLYVINEVGSTISAFEFDSATGKAAQIQTVSTLPEGRRGANSTAEIVVHPTGRFLYGSNRGHDSIAVFAINPENGKLSPVQHQGEGVHEPRNFTIDPTGQWLLVGNQRTDNISVYKIDGETGRLTPTGHKVNIPAPVCIRLLAVE